MAISACLTPTQESPHVDSILLTFSQCLLLELCLKLGKVSVQLPDVFINLET